LHTSIRRRALLVLLFRRAVARRNLLRRRGFGRAAVSFRIPARVVARRGAFGLSVRPRRSTRFRLGALLFRADFLDLLLHRLAPAGHDLALRLLVQAGQEVRPRTTDLVGIPRLLKFRDALLQHRLRLVHAVGADTNLPAARAAASPLRPSSSWRGGSA